MEILETIAGLGIWITGFALAPFFSLRIGERLGRGCLARLHEKYHPISKIFQVLLFASSGLMGGLLGGIAGGRLGGGFIALFSTLLSQHIYSREALIWILICSGIGSLIGGVVGAAVGLTASIIEGYASIKHSETDQQL